MVRRMCSHPIDPTVSGQFRIRCDRTGGRPSVGLLVSPESPCCQVTRQNSDQLLSLFVCGLRLLSDARAWVSSARVVEIYKDRRDSPPPPSAHSELWAAHAKNRVAHSVSPAAIASTGVPSMLLI